MDREAVLIIDKKERIAVRSDGSFDRLGRKPDLSSFGQDHDKVRCLIRAYVKKKEIMLPGGAHDDLSSVIAWKCAREFPAMKKQYVYGYRITPGHYADRVQIFFVRKSYVYAIRRVLARNHIVRCAFSLSADGEEAELSALPSASLHWLWLLIVSVLLIVTFVNLTSFMQARVNSEQRVDQPLHAVGTHALHGSIQLTQPSRNIGSVIGELEKFHAELTGQLNVESLTYNPEDRELWFEGWASSYPEAILQTCERVSIGNKGFYYHIRGAFRVKE